MTDGLRHRRSELFATERDVPRAHRAGDAIQLGLAAIALIVVSAVAVPEPAFLRALTRLFATLPDFLRGLWQVLSDVMVLGAVLTLVASAYRRRWDLVRDMVLGAVLAIVLSLIAAQVVEGSWPRVWDGLRAATGPPRYPSPRLALAGAVLLTASPHLSRPARRLATYLLMAGTFALVALEASSALGAFAGVLIAVMASAIVHLVLGSTAGRPSIQMVGAALAELNVDATVLGAADRQRAGVYIIQAVTPGGGELIVKVYGRDAHDTAVTAGIIRRVWFREAGTPLRLGRLQQVEHEAFLTLFARQGGIVTDHVVTAGATATDDAVLVLRREGRLLSDLDAGEIAGIDLAHGIWRVVERLQVHSLAHGQIDDSQLLVVDGELGLADFRGGIVPASLAQRSTDEVQALVTVSALVSPQAAVDSALAALGPVELAAMLPYVQPATLTSRQRDWVKDDRVDLNELRSLAATAVGTEPPKLIQLRRVTFGSVVRVLLPALAVFMLLSGLAGLDLSDFGEEVSQATWWMLAVGLIIAQLPRLTQAVSTLGASPVPLPLGPVYALQLAISYINIAIPSAAARVAVNVRFFQRHGVPPGAAIAAGAIDGFGGFVGQALILITLLFFTPASLDLDVDRAVDGAQSLLVVALVIAAISIAVVAAVASWRRFVQSWARRLLTEMWSAVRGLNSPRRIALLFGGNLATELLFAMALATFTHALGHPIGLMPALLINISVGLLSGLIPVPGGIGVTEGGLTFGLVQAGVPEASALAAVLMYRFATFYLPPIWGFFALRWLERREQL